MSDKRDIHPDGLPHPSPSIEAAVRGELMTPQQGAALADELAELRRKAAAWDGAQHIWARLDADAGSGATSVLDLLDWIRPGSIARLNTGDPA